MTRISVWFEEQDKQVSVNILQNLKKDILSSFFCVCTKLLDALKVSQNLFVIVSHFVRFIGQLSIQNSTLTCLILGGIIWGKRPEFKLALFSGTVKRPLPNSNQQTFFPVQFHVQSFITITQQAWNTKEDWNLSQEQNSYSRY